MAFSAPATSGIAQSCAEDEKFSPHFKEDTRRFGGKTLFSAFPAVFTMRIKARKASTKHEAKVTLLKNKNIEFAKQNMFRRSAHFVYKPFQPNPQKEFVEGLVKCTDEELVDKLQSIKQWEWAEQVNFGLHRLQLC